MLFLSGQPLQKMPAYYAAKMLAEEWTQPNSGRHMMYSATTDDPKIAAYTVERPDRLLSILILNKDPARYVTVRVPMRGQVEARQYSPVQYEWHAALANGHPTRNNPPARIVVRDGLVRLPPYSITVVRGSLP